MLNKHDENFHSLLKLVLETGQKVSDRTGTGTRRVICPPQMVYDLSTDFPLITTKKVHWDSLVRELLWFLRGDTNVKYLQDNNVRIWNEWADENGDLGPVYGHQWRSWGGEIITNESGEVIKTVPGVDQIEQVIQSLRKDPFGRRHIVSAWNVSDIPHMKLPPCHCFFQFFVEPNNVNGRTEMRLTCKLYQRSADLFLGVPFNIASYALLTMIIAQCTGYVPGRFIHDLGDAHIYLNHLDQVQEQLSRSSFKAPTVRINPDLVSIDDLEFSDIILEGYKHHEAIKAKVAV